MTDALFKLHAWLSPAYPVGAYTYSQGLEWAISVGTVFDAESTQAWVQDCLTVGAGRTDAILLAHAWKAEGEPARLSDIAELAQALAPSVERMTETRDMGRAFADVTSAAWGDATLIEGCSDPPFPVALGHAAWTHQIPLDQTLPLFLQAFAANMISAAVRLVPLGQTEGQRIVAAMLPLCNRMAMEAKDAPLDDIGGCSIAADIASMRHETQDVRLFRS